MKLLIVTQKVDKQDPILGFFHRWIEELSKHCEQVTVIGQYVGQHTLPVNVHVVSLGKEHGHSRIRQIFNFQFSIFNFRREYDTVFVHMTPIWIVFGAPFWALLRKRMYLWYEARGKRWPLRCALLFVQKVFSASQGGMPLQSKKSVITGHGIDTNRFGFGFGGRDSKLIITVGRITASKHLDEVLECFAKLPEQYKLIIAGRTITNDDEKVLEMIKAQIDEMRLSGRVSIQSLPQPDVVVRLQNASVFLHASETPLDKAILEAMACGCPVVSLNPLVHEFLPEVCRATSEHEFSARAENVLHLSTQDRESMEKEVRGIIENGHSLANLAKRLITEMQT